MNYLSVCSGIEAASVAWKPMNWNAVGFSEIEAFPSAVLKYHFPTVKNYGDMTNYEKWKIEKPVDVLVGGTPCQSFSIAGLRQGLNDDRGNLTLTFLKMVKRFNPKWVVWENVPGVLSDRTNAFGQFLCGLSNLGYQYAYRVLDAQHFGVPQRRRRIFVVASFGKQRAAQVLFEPESLCGNFKASEKTQKETSENFSKSPGANNRKSNDVIAPCLDAHIESKFGSNQWVDSGQWILASGQAGSSIAQNIAPTLTCLREQPVVNVFEPKAIGIIQQSKIAGTLTRNCGGGGETQNPAFLEQYQRIRKLTPKECERLQGFPDDWTQIPYRNKSKTGCPDGPRYKALGNSMAVPVMRWIGERINKLEST